MVTLEELRSALIKADAAYNAGDESAAADARILAKEILRRQGDSQEISYADYARQVLGQGTLMGFGDEILGAGRGTYTAATTDKPLSDAISEGIDKERAINTRTENILGPWKTMGLQAGGGLLSGGVGAGRAVTSAGARMAPRLAAASKVGAIQGGITGGGMSEGGVVNRVIGGIQGAGTGALLAPAMTVAGRGAGAIKDQLGRMLPQGAKRQAEGLLKYSTPAKDADRMERDLARMPKESVVADVAPLDARKIAGDASRSVGSGPQTEAIKARHRAQYERVIPKISAHVSDKRVSAAIEDLTSARRAAAKKQYGDLYEQELPMNEQLTKLFDNPALKDAYANARKMAGYAGKMPPEGDWGTAKLRPTVELGDFLKQSLDDMVNSAYANNTPKMGGVLKNVRDDLRDALDEAVPDYKKVRSVYAGYSAAMEAAEKGVQFMRSTLSEDLGSLKGLVDAEDIASMGAHEKEAFLSGVGAVLKDKVESKGFGADVTKIFDNPKVQGKLRAALGDDGADSFLKTISDESKMAQTFAENVGSPTGQRLSVAGTVGTPVGVLQDAAQTATSPNPTAGFGFAKRMMDRLQTPPESVARELSQLMLSSNPADKARALSIIRSQGLGSEVSGVLAPAVLSSVGGYSGGVYGAESDPYILDPYK